MIAVDWGTTSLRAYRLDGNGEVLDARASNKGILALPPGPQVLEGELQDWLDDGPIVMSGMVGSRQGWVEAPYVECPAGLAELAPALKEVRWSTRRAWIVPGVVCRGAVPDVMRGEEVQVLGAERDGLFCLPGTHSKWVEVRNGRIERFSTAMTGEVYAVLRQHSILGRMMEDGKPDAEAFAQGVRRAGAPGGLLHHLFGVRTLGLLGELGPAASPLYLSGILIGHEVRLAGGAFALIGDAILMDLYRQAAGIVGIEANTCAPESGTRALFRLAAAIP